MTNAAQHIDGQGRIHIGTKADATTVYVRIAEMGWGISLENLERFFDPAFTTQGARGLGLSTGYNIVQRLKGWIYVESVVGRGLRLGWSCCEKGEGLEISNMEG